jgi:hypothetical protein
MLLIRALFAIFVICACLLPTTVYGQTESDNGEVAALGGVTLGAGTQPAVIASAGIGFSKYGMGMFSIGFSPLGQSTIQPWPAHVTVDRSLLYDFGADFHLRIPVGERWAPYGIAGAGLLWNTIRQNTAAGGRHFDQFNGALHTGAGVRFYVNKSWGIRPEVKVVVSKQIYTQLMFGFFYVTPPSWP